MTSFVIWLANPETHTVHKGVAEGRARKWDPRCNIPTARSEGDAGTITIDESEAARWVAEEGYEWCRWCVD